MAAKTKEMNQIKQVILRHMQGESNRSIARALGISKNTVNRYVSLAEGDKLPLKDLVKLEDPVLDFRFNGGSPRMRTSASRTSWPGSHTLRVRCAAST